MTGQQLRVIEICAGAGGQSLGLERAGFEHELAVELDQNAVNTLLHNRPHWKVAHGDVADLNVWNPADYAPAEGRLPIDLLAGGVPCPPFTIAGKQLGATDERDLFAWAIEQVDVLRPRALLLENVRGLSLPRFAGYRQHVLDRLLEFGYVAEWKLLEAADYGVPQLRPRFVLVAMAAQEFAYFHWPEPAGQPPTVGEVLLPLMAANGWEGATSWAAKADDIAPTIVGGSKKHGGADLGPTRAKRAWAKLGVDAFGVHDTAPPYPASRPMTEYGPKLTCDMVARIQGWDDDEFRWSFTGRKTSVYRQIGNAFPPPVAKAIGVSIARALRHEGVPRNVGNDVDHDPVYRVLQGASSYLTSDQIIKRLDGRVDVAEVEKRIAMLGRDFFIEMQGEAETVAYRLGEFRAFRGQEDHIRHDEFGKNRSKVS
uniref:DNA cytosine methyltransferase n=1 Tax=Herbidospora sakaeratensis TaxID=564415 RepID=UPI000A5EEFC1|nr:DNA (cytosine-5-)-methyltransferase [Herbidospora sakaeratensis]